MRHRTLASTAGLAVVAMVTLALATGPAGQAAPATARSAATEMVDVLVVLRRQAALPSNPNASRRDRLRATLRALRDTADGEQRRLVALLAVRKLQGRVSRVRPYWIFNGLHVVAEQGVIDELAALPEVAAIRPNATVQAPSASAAAAGPEWNVARVNAPALWELGYRGQGIVVANMDTGVDVTHPDLTSRWRGGANSWFDATGQHPSTPTDVNGHGTSTMGVMVGGGAGGTAVGVAPDARWIAVRIFNDAGTATTAGIHAGFQWLLDPDGNPSTHDAPAVVNHSWTMTDPGCNLEFQPDLRSLRAAGILPVFSAGNGGALNVSPANNPEAFAVGGTDAANVLAAGSSRGPSACGQASWPQLAAPGVDVRTTHLFGLYATVSGTSIAAPHAAGALALLLSAYPDLSADRQQSALEGGAVDLGAPGPDDDYGAGLLDVLGARTWLATAPDFTLGATPPSASTAAGGGVSYTVSVGALNGFSGDVGLALSGLSSSQASWTLAPAVVAGGSGSSQLTVTTAAGLAPGSYPLTITGSSGSIAHTVSVTLVVPAPPDFTVSVTPSSRSTLAGGGVSYTVSVGALNGFGGDVSLALSGLSASQAGWTFAPAAVAGGSGSSQLTVTTAAGLAPGSYPLTITGSSGPIAHTAVRDAGGHGGAGLRAVRHTILRHGHRGPEHRLHGHRRLAGGLLRQRHPLGQRPSVRRDCELRAQPGARAGNLDHDRADGSPHHARHIHPQDHR